MPSSPFATSITKAPRRATVAVRESLLPTDVKRQTRRRKKSETYEVYHIYERQARRQARNEDFSRAPAAHFSRKISRKIFPAARRLFPCEPRAGSRSAHFELAARLATRRHGDVRLSRLLLQLPLPRLPLD